jgi:hypothetical protein
MEVVPLELASRAVEPVVRVQPAIGRRVGASVRATTSMRDGRADRTDRARRCRGGSARHAVLALLRHDRLARAARQRQHHERGVATLVADERDAASVRDQRGSVASNSPKVSGYGASPSRS